MPLFPSLSLSPEPSLSPPARKRLRKILTTIAAHGLGGLIGRKPAKAASLNLWQRVRGLLEELGPTFIKLGQILANRTDLLPEGLLLELQHLQDRVTPFSGSLAAQIVEAELGSPLSGLFSDFDETPLASASIAQVHKARLKSGVPVVLKVQRPGIEEIIALDLEVLAKAGVWIEKLIFRSDVIDTRSILEEFSRTIRRELDFKNEALFLEKFSSQFKDEPEIVIPRLYKPYSRRRVLCMEYIVGLHPLDFQGFERLGLKRKELARRGAELLLKQIFLYGFFHADPHPGNVLILPDGRICFLDFGMMGILYERHREHLGGMLLAVALKDGEALARHLRSLTRNPQDVRLSELEEDVHNLMETYAHLPLKEIDITQFLVQATNLLLDHRLQLPPSLYLLVKALITTEGLARQLDPDFDMMSVLSPFVQEVFLKNADPVRLAGGSVETLGSYARLLQELPDELKELIEVAKRAQLTFALEEKTTEQLLHKADRLVNRLAFSLIVTGGVVASSMALQSPIPPLWNGIPIIAIIGYAGSALLGFALLISIWRSGRL